MNKDLFIKLINLLEKETREREEKAKLMQKLFPQDSCIMPDLDIIENIIDMLDKHFGDDWISYYAWELYFGKGMSKDCVEANGKKYSL